MNGSGPWKEPPEGKLATRSGRDVPPPISNRENHCATTLSVQSRGCAVWADGPQWQAPTGGVR